MTISRTSGFLGFDISHEELVRRTDDPFPTALRSWRSEKLAIAAEGTHFGFILKGPSRLLCGSGEFLVQAGMYFSVPGNMVIEGGEGIIVTRLGYTGLFSLGGPIEDRGRLRYINGCTDSLLISPVLLGDPCINFLHLPPNTEQSAHTHPSLRAGAIIRGTGECVLTDRRVPLKPGLVFLIEADTLHSFHTRDSELLVVAYHPDSDFGPTHEHHPMVNRTILATAKDLR